MKNSIKRIFVFIIILANIGCDQVSKNIVQKKVIPGDYIHVLGDNIILTNVENTGAALGLGQNLPPTLKLIFLNLMPCFILFFMTYFLIKNKVKNRWATIAISFIIGGGLGNLTDRFLYGSVTDFLHIKLGFFKTGIFNMADVSVTIGALFLIYLNIFKKNEIFIK